MSQTLPLTVSIDFDVFVNSSIGLTLVLEPVPAGTLERTIAQDTHTLEIQSEERENTAKCRPFSPFMPLKR